MKHFIIVGVLVVLMSALTYFGLTAIGLMPVEASAQAIPVDWMWNLQVMAMSFLFALIVVPLVYSLFVFRRRRGDTGDAEHIEGNTKLEITWTILPLIAVLTFAYLGAYTLGQTRVADPQAMTIKVHASQWTWSFEYPQGFTSKELRLPLNRQVVLEMDSKDVIHSFWVPEFRIKQDVVPGRVTEYRITPTLIGTYKVRCAELCGLSHAYMESPVVVMSPADFDAWVAAQSKAAAAAQAAGGAENGKVLATKFGCLGCHSSDGSKSVGPTWQGLFGAQVELSNGTTITADEAYLIESIVDPGAKIRAGFPAGSMPSFKDQLSTTQINDLVAYIKSLK